ncbi:hypothetical protein A3A09_01330 [Candidatus Nomurabacteria bacterium RIFCSPLOWO2_01_FULL_42_20]|uniref:Uncharacterized protein n=1 Tax=Candidatus Nomurabacteria bacterium RIFCSPHIGHO2_01_FULL_42_16 TaxID=1801743 RepID=A0A1F6VHX2_9BACT|nr:MAG: hypothetical protein A2824_01705 [Candidatus Nomurabacteria bacterium RIFCSPHIGHO2_01_FULL_42_16]OGI92380.1 MAG: hypothetical protein A3A09_01330 [Candidatus Nomurabacteria bacterium RIFCSPLOWO2_01_FULL_42_20]
MIIDIKKLKKKLEEEKVLLHGELKRLGVEVSHKREDWEATPVLEETSVNEPDENSLADHFEDFEERSAELNVLKARLKEVNSALARIESNTYGKCRIDGKNIEEDRLEANPAADTCKAHME